MSLINLFTKSKSIQVPDVPVNDVLPKQVTDILKKNQIELDKSIRDLEDFSQNGLKKSVGNREQLIASLEKLAQSARTSVKK